MVVYLMVRSSDWRSRGRVVDSTPGNFVVIDDSDQVVQTPGSIILYWSMAVMFCGSDGTRPRAWQKVVVAFMT